MTPDSPAARLFQEPFVFDFFQAVWLLEELYPRRAPVGGNGPPGAEVVQFVSRASLAFPASAIDRLDHRPDDNEPPRMAVNFFGLTGPNGVLPVVYTQWQIHRSRATDDPEAGAYAAWLDLLTHRLLSLFYQAGTKYRLPRNCHPEVLSGRTPPIVTAAVSLIGLGTPGLSGRCRADEAEETSSDEPAGLEDIALLRYAELLSHVNRPAVGLEGLLADYFEIPVTVVPCVGRWMPLDDDNQTRLGRTGWNDRLGEGTLVGRRVWDAASAIRIVLGPLDGASFQSWLPDRPRIHVLAKLTQLYLRGELRFIVQLVLKARDIPALQLARAGPRARLGWNTWLWTRPRTYDADDVVFRRIRPKL